MIYHAKARHFVFRTFFVMLECRNSDVGDIGARKKNMQNALDWGLSYPHTIGWLLHNVYHKIAFVGDAK